MFGPTISHLKLAIELAGLTLWDRGKAEIIIIIIKLEVYGPYGPDF